MAFLRHRGCEGPPKLLLAAVGVFALALTWRLMMRTGPESDWREPVFMVLALGSGGAASVVGLQYLLRPSSLAAGIQQAEDPGTDSVDGGPLPTEDDISVEKAVSEAVVHHVEILPLGHATPVAIRPPEALPAPRGRPVADRGLGPVPRFERMASTELGELVAGLYRRRGESVEMQADPGSGAADMVVLAVGKRRVVHCLVGPEEVTPSAVRELVGFRDIEHADDATLVTTVHGSEAARNLAVEQGIQWIGPAELSEWMAVAGAS